MTTAALQLADLLTDPRESLDVEIKSWLDLGDKEHAGALAKAVVALANHGGGTLILGFAEESESHIFRPAPNRPAELTSYGQDAVNASPARPESFAVSEYVELAHRRWLGYRAGKEPLPSAAYFIYTFFHSLGWRSKKDIAAMFQIDKAVLDKLSELSTNAGGADAVRKFQVAVPPARMPDAERAWLEAAVLRLVRRLGEYTAAANLERITMDDLPALP